MGYVQMTLNDWIEIKQKLRQELLGVKQSFVRIGYMLRQINDQKGYEQDGYKSIAEFAQKELGLHPSTTTRFMEINREYSIDGYSERLRPEYLDLSRSQLEEMLKLPDEDRTMIQTDTSREGIRELKRFNNAVPETGANTIKELVESFFHDNKEILNAVFAEEFTTKQFSEIVNPSGNRSYKKGLYFLMMYENRIAVKKFGETPVNMTWDEFKRQTEDIFQEAAGPDTWRNYFGEAEKTEQETASPGSDEKHGNKNECSTEKRTMENPKGPADDGREEEKNDSKRMGTDQEFDKGIEGRGNAVQTQENKGEEQIAPAQKTEEQKYNEKQAKLDRETKRKLEEQEDEEKMEHLPSDEPKKTKQLRMAFTYYDEIVSGKMTFWFCKNDNFHIGDEMDLMEFKDGRHTGRTIQTEITYILDDYTGLEDGYCVLAIKVTGAI